MLTEKEICFVVASGEFDAGGGGSGFEESFDGVGSAAVFPVRVDRGFDGELNGGAALAVEGVDWGAAGYEELDGFGPRAPGGYGLIGAECWRRRRSASS